MMDIGNAPVSWGIFSAADTRTGPERYLDEVAEAGYRTTELGPYGFLPTDPGVLAEMLETRGLKLVGAVHVHDFTDPDSGPGLDRALADIARLTRPLGSGHIVVMDGGKHYPETLWDGRPVETLSAAGWRAMLRMLEDSRKRLAGEADMVLSLHPHVATAIERGDQIERLLDATDLGLCFDTGHHAVWDEDVPGYMDKVFERIVYMHLKNTDPAIRARVLDGALALKPAFGKGLMCPLPDGVVDIPAVLGFLTERRFAGPVIVEQDLSDDPAARPADLARKNAEFVAEALAGR